MYRPNWPAKQLNSVKNAKQGYYAVKGHCHRGWYQSKVCNFLLVINSNMTSYLVPFRSYRSLMFKFWILCVLQPPFGGWA